MEMQSHAGLDYLKSSCPELRYIKLFKLYGLHLNMLVLSVSSLYYPCPVEQHLLGLLGCQSVNLPYDNKVLSVPYNVLWIIRDNSNISYLFVESKMLCKIQKLSVAFFC